MATVNAAMVHLWDHRVGAVVLDNHGHGVFEYDPAFIKLGLDIAPITMPISGRGRIHSFPGLNPETYKRLPGLLADALPDKFGQAVVDSWLARQGRAPEDFSIIERLCYTGTRAMGALEFQPAFKPQVKDAVDIDVDKMVELVREIIEKRTGLNETLTHKGKVNEDALMNILVVGTSAGGARAKAVIAYNEKTGQVKSGQADAPPGFSHWLLKFDGASDLELGKTEGFGRIEYAYYLMAREAGIEMTESRLLKEHDRAHFITRRFDRVGNDKLHLQSLCAIAHYDFNMPGAYSYEQALQIMRKMRLPKSAQLELFRRMVFNVMARNQDDHTKNIAFLMNPKGEWSLSPAYDMTYAYNPKGHWTHQHQMTIDGQQDAITISNLKAVANSSDLPRAETVIEEVGVAIGKWEQFAEKAGVSDDKTDAIQRQHRIIK
jgi:serine/threonine-protein kinase HipA